MSLESVTHISDLNASNPTAGDPKSQGDDHIRNIKTALKTDFPNITGVMSLSHTQLNLLDSKLLANAGYQKLPSGLIVQWGTNLLATGNGDAIAFPIAFPSTALKVITSDAGSGARSTGQSGVTTAGFLGYGKDGASYASTTISWVALGY